VYGVHAEIVSPDIVSVYPVYIITWKLLL